MPSTGCFLIQQICFQEARQKKARAKRERQRMQVYTGDFFKDPSPDSEPSDDRYCGFGMSDVSEEPTGFVVPPASVQSVRMAESDYWDIPPVMYVLLLLLHPFNSLFSRTITVPER